MFETVISAVSICIALGALLEVRRFNARVEKERDRDRLLAEKERLEATKEKERDRLEAEKVKQEAERKDRLMFLSGVILDKSIGKSARQGGLQ